MNYKYGHTKAKKEAVKDILESEKQCYVFSFPNLKKLPKEKKISINTMKL